jgi:hypothetical protein
MISSMNSQLGLIYAQTTLINPGLSKAWDDGQRFKKIVGSFNVDVTDFSVLKTGFYDKSLSRIRDSAGPQNFNGAQYVTRLEVDFTRNCLLNYDNVLIHGSSVPSLIKNRDKTQQLLK